MKAELFKNKLVAGDSPNFTWLGGLMFLDINGTVDGAEISLFINAGNGNKTNPDLTKSETGLFEVGIVPAGSQINCVISGAGASTNLSVIAVNG
jgi:hypothetical protein